MQKCCLRLPARGMRAASTRLQSHSALQGSGFSARGQASIRRFHGYGGARGLASHEIYELPALVARALQRRLPTQSAASTGRQGSPAAFLASTRRGPVTQQRATAVAANRGTAPAPRPAPPRRLPRKRRARPLVTSQRRCPARAFPPRDEGWAPARPRPPAPASIRWMTC